MKNMSRNTREGRYVGHKEKTAVRDAKPVGNERSSVGWKSVAATLFGRAETANARAIARQATQ